MDSTDGAGSGRRSVGLDERSHEGHGEPALVRHRVVVEPVEQRDETRHVPPVAGEHVAYNVVRNLDAATARVPPERSGPTRVIELAPLDPGVAPA